MSKKQLQTTQAPAPVGAYSQGMRAGDFVFVSGQVGRTAQSGELAEGIEAQTAQTLENIKAILAADGLDLSDVVKSTVHLKDMTLFKKFDEVYGTYFPDPKPIRTTVGSFLPKALVEIDVTAYAPVKS